MLAEIITIGDEILIGQIIDSNSAWMAVELNKIGVKIKQITSVSDDAEHIKEALREAEKRANIILITGGLGPTKDDITKKTLAEYYKSGGMVLHQPTLDKVASIFAKYNAPVTELNKLQAMVPDNCEVILNENGTAPCMLFRNEDRMIVSMPGVPFEMMALMQDKILPLIKATYNLPSIFHKTILTAGIGESFLAEKIAHIEDSLPAYIKLAYLPKLGIVRLRLSTVTGITPETQQEVEHFAKLIKNEIEDFWVADEDIPLEKAILNLMDAQKLTLSVAESCTGGYLSHLLTQHPGSSSVFLGGGIVYANALKMKQLDVSSQTLDTYGAVSEETVIEMANGAIKNFNSDYAIAISGIAGPDGGTAEKPVGTVWIAVAHQHQTIAKKFTFSNKRLQNIERAAIAALNLLLRLLKQHQA
ncbi:competence/damage-inducible protein A [Pedobacter puniceum]|uniref:CinA-like protein n=1 Tax=Pedobacter puniceum TaxID=2666136 RepID=A0A7K0FTR3_9SPHI|nr:competence/damage-inducible protein A [Pedobacter puniceum]MRX48730.1 competence/damage-inducible protein A [Pedobacter puniceum]